MSDNKSELKSIVKNWELLRLGYNFVLLIIGLALSYKLIPYFGSVGYLRNIIIFGAVANVFYCLGPIIELYLYVLGVKIGKVRYILFGLGLAFSVAVILALSGLAKFAMDMIKD